MNQENKQNLIKKVKLIFEKRESVELAYLFGSQANGNSGPMSDYDFAIYLDEKLNETEMFKIKLELISDLSLFLKTDNIDVVVLNLTESPELKYAIINGDIILERDKEQKVIIEPKILNEYFDFKMILSRYGLTKYQETYA